MWCVLQQYTHTHAVHTTLQAWRCFFSEWLPVVPTECDVLIVCRQHNDKEWKFKEQHAKMWENIVEAKRYSCPRGFNIAGASTPVAPAFLRPLVAAGLCRV